MNDTANPRVLWVLERFSMRTDEELVVAIRGGEIDAFDLLYQRYASRLFGYVLRHVQERATAEDLLQEIFMTVLEEKAYRLEPGRFAAWLFTVARNRCLTHLRTRDRRSEKLSEINKEPEAPTIEDRLAERQVLSAALATLSESHQDALILKEVGGLTYREIAAVQSVPEGTAKSRLHFAVKAVRRFLTQENG